MKNIKYNKSNGCQVEVLSTFIVDNIEMSYIEYTGETNIDLGSISVGGSVNCYGNGPVFTDPEEVEIAEVFTDWRETIESSMLVTNLNLITPIKAYKEAQQKYIEIKKEISVKQNEEKTIIKQITEHKKVEKTILTNISEQSLNIIQLDNEIQAKRKLVKDLNIKINQSEEKLKNNTKTEITDLKVKKVNEKSETYLSIQTEVEAFIKEIGFESFKRNYLENDNDKYIIIEREDEFEEEVYQKGQHWEYSSFDLIKNGETLNICMTRLVDPRYEDTIEAINVS